MVEMVFGVKLKGLILLYYWIYVVGFNEFSTRNSNHKKFEDFFWMHGWSF